MRMLIDFFKEFNLFQKLTMVSIIGTGILYAVTNVRLLLVAGLIEFILLVFSIRE